MKSFKFQIEIYRNGKKLLHSEKQDVLSEMYSKFPGAEMALDLYPCFVRWACCLSDMIEFSSMHPQCLFYVSAENHCGDIVLSTFYQGRQIA